jgi:hypothetical protein
MVRLHPDPPTIQRETRGGAIAQLGERLLCKQEVTGSIPVGSTSSDGKRNQQSMSRDVAMLIGASSSAEVGCSLTIWD